MCPYSNYSNEDYVMRSETPSSSWNGLVGPTTWTENYVIRGMAVVPTLLDFHHDPLEIVPRCVHIMGLLSVLSGEFNHFLFVLRSDEELAVLEPGV